MRGSSDLDLDTINQIIGDSQMLEWVLTGATQFFEQLLHNLEI